ncbi:glycosyl hydrolase family 85-domain-containing protein [Lipomyces japonicus]|uniref:glycosyl hydrolase family 85-domain-containing protein n=1 Tax=Lipomyces japonicus TaxID=56871 RepID=UPI0034CD9EBD
MSQISFDTCRYFDSLESLSTWDETQDSLQKCRAPLRTRHRHPDRSCTARLLLCHDFKGGYSDSEDRSFQGYFPHDSGIAYWARGLSLVDTFVYFSHKRVAVPPVTWTTACHKAGTRSLGTICFEHNDSVAEARIILKENEHGGYVYADMLARVAVHYGFDGYLLNMEITLGDRNEALQMLLFVEYLKFKLHKVIGSTARVIWYDSLTLDNKLEYQNALNYKTLPFFKSSDGLFTNYFWKDEQVYNGVKLAGKYFRRNLWTGLDVWGRNVSYPAKAEIGKAMRRVQSSQTSFALFAPAWTYEELGRANFDANDFAFWYNSPDPAKFQNNSISEFIEPHPAPVLNTVKYNLFYTSFNTGHGSSFFVNGKLEYSDNWVSHALQTALPTYPYASDSPRKREYEHRLCDNRVTTAPGGSFKIFWSLDTTRVFYGGSSLKLTSDPFNTSPYEAIFTSRRPGTASSDSSLSSSPGRGLGKKVSSLSLNAALRVQATPLFALDFVVEPDSTFIFLVTFLKCAKGDVQIRLGGRWILDDLENGPASCFDEHATHSHENFEVDLSGSVLDSWVRKSFNLKTGHPPSSCDARAKHALQITNLDIVCNENFSGTIYLGSLLLFLNKDRSMAISAPGRVSNVTVEPCNHDSGRHMIRWRNDAEATEWLVFINGQMVGVATSTGYVIADNVMDRDNNRNFGVRIDAVGCAGSIVKGVEQAFVLI